MFFFHRDYFRNARGQHLKVFFYGLLMMLLAFILMTVLTVVVFGGGMGMIFGDYIALGIMTFIFGGLLLLAFSILVLMPLQYSIYAYYMYGYNGTDFSFKDGLILFRKGNFWKSVGIILLLMIMAMVISSVVSGVVYGLVFVVASLFGVGSALIDPEGIEALSIGASIVLIILQFVLAMFQIAFSILTQLAITMVMLNHIDQPQTTLGSKLAKGLTIAFQSFKDLLKLLFSNFILMILPVILIFAAIIIMVVAGLTLSTSDTMPVGIAVGMIILTIGIMIMYIFIGYYMIGSFISYYFNGRDRYERKHEAPSQDDYRVDDTQHITMS